MTSLHIGNLSLQTSPPPANGNEDFSDASNRYADVLTVVRLAVTTCVFVVTLVGNILAIYFVSNKKELLGLKNYYYGYYLISLGVSDILVAVLCIPFTVVYYESQRWPLGGVMCKLLPALQITVVTTSIGTLVVITFDRYRAILHPMQPRSSLLGIKIKICCVWIWAFSMGAPLLSANKYNPDLPQYQCQEVWTSQRYRQVYTVVILLFDYVLPLILISFLYTRIIMKLKQNVGATRTKETKHLHQRFLRSTALLVTSFAICYLPAKVCFLVMDFGSVKHPKLFTVVLNFGHILIWFNSCLNPFIYGTVYGFFRAKLRRSNTATYITILHDKHMDEATKRGDYAQCLIHYDNSQELRVPLEQLKFATESIV